MYFDAHKQRQRQSSCIPARMTLQLKLLKDGTLPTMRYGNWGSGCRGIVGRRVPLGGVVGPLVVLGLGVGWVVVVLVVAAGLVDWASVSVSHHLLLGPYCHAAPRARRRMRRTVYCFCMRITDSCLKEQHKRHSIHINPSEGNTQSPSKNIYTDTL